MMDQGDGIPEALKVLFPTPIMSGANSRPGSNKANSVGENRLATVFRDWALISEARPLAEAIHHKLRCLNIWLWIFGDIEHHLGLDGPKDSSIGAPFLARMAFEPFSPVFHVGNTVATFAQWLEKREAKT